jgi:hypothetical protein
MDVLPRQRGDLVNRRRQRYNLTRTCLSMERPVNSARAEALAERPSQRFSLLRLSALARLSFALGVIAFMWGIVFWALS